MKGEIWKFIPGFEGYYMASNLGRIKSVDRTIPHPRLYTQFVEGRILSQSIAKNRNLRTGEPMIDLRVSLNMEGTQYYFNTRRIIYQTFKNKKLDYVRDGLYIINKDGNGYNNRVSNLKAVTKSEKSQRVFKRERHTTDYLRTADRSKWPKTYGGYARRKSIKQYTLGGKLVAHFESVNEAHRKTGCDPKGISAAAKGLYAQWRGYKWKFATR
jgi:hypothetical protein